MATTIGKLAVTLTADTKRLRKGLGRAGKRVKGFAKSIGGVAKRVAKFGAIIAGAAAAGLGYFIRREMQAIDATAKLSRRAGVAIEYMQGLQHAAELTGFSSEQMSKSMDVLNRRLGQAAQGTGQAGRALDKLGLDAEQLIDLPVQERLLKIADAMQGLEDPSDKAAVAADLFSRQGIAMVNMLDTGSEGIKSMIAQSRRLRGSLTEIDAAKVESANDAFSRLGLSIRGVVQRLAVSLAPFAERVADMLTFGFVWARKTVVPMIGDLANGVLKHLSGLVRAVTPYVNTFGKVIIGWYSVVAKAYSAVATTVGKIVTSIGKSLGVLGRNNETVMQSILKALITVEYAFDNWGQNSGLVLLQLQYKVVKIGAQIKHVFTGLIPDTLMWLKQNWGNILTDMGNVFVAVVKDIASNAAQLGKNLGKLLIGKIEAEDLFENLGSKYQDALADGLTPPPDFAERTIGPLETELKQGVDALAAEVGQGFAGYMEDRMAEIEGMDVDIASWFKGLDNLVGLGDLELPDMDVDLNLDEKDAEKLKWAVSEAQRPAALQRGTREAFSASLPQRTQQRAMADTAKNTEESADTLKSIDDNLRKNNQSATAVGGASI